MRLISWNDDKLRSIEMGMFVGGKPAREQSHCLGTPNTRAFANPRTSEQQIVSDKECMAE